MCTSFLIYQFPYASPSSSFIMSASCKRKAWHIQGHGQQTEVNTNSAKMAYIHTYHVHCLATISYISQYTYERSKTNTSADQKAKKVWDHNIHHTLIHPYMIFFGATVTEITNTHFWQNKFTPPLWKPHDFMDWNQVSNRFVIHLIISHTHNKSLTKLTHISFPLITLI